jgi:hypothetical protein
MAAHLDVPVTQDCLRAVLFAEINPKRELKDGLLQVDRRTDAETPPPTLWAHQITMSAY